MIIITWAELSDAVQTLAKMLSGKKVYGIPRGGAIVAGMLSYWGCELVELLNPHFPVGYAELFGLDEIIVVDDIADEGKTLAKWREKGFMTAALFVRRECKPQPNYFVKVIDEGDYILFPYEDPVKAQALEDSGVYRDGS